MLKIKCTKRPRMAFKPASLELDRRTGKMKTTKPVKVGDYLELLGRPADGSYELSDGRVLVCVNGTIKEVLTF